MLQSSNAANWVTKLTHLAFFHGSLTVHVVWYGEALNSHLCTFSVDHACVKLGDTCFTCKAFIYGSVPGLFQGRQGRWDHDLTKGRLAGRHKWRPQQDVTQDDLVLRKRCTNTFWTNPDQEKRPSHSTGPDKPWFTDSSQSSDRVDLSPLPSAAGCCSGSL